MKPKALVTGATGGLGRVLAPMLQAQGREVIATGRNSAIGRELAVAGMSFASADLAQDDLAGLCDGVGTVFHLAALSSPWGRRQDFVDANVVATQRLLAAAKAAGCQRFIFASTPSIYTRAIDQLGLDENSPLPDSFANDYAATKYRAEELVLAAAEEDFATVALRPRAIISPYDTALLPRLLQGGGNGVLPLPRGGKALIEPTDARDTAAAFMAAEAQAERVSGQAFNISGGTPIPLAELASHVFARLDKPLKVIAVPGKLAIGAARLMERAARLTPSGKEPRLTRYSAMVLGWSQTFDLTAAHEKLNWRARFAPLEAVDWALAEMRGA
ncbi:MAG: NAD-dependent epimerase/dehydratase family protein [Pseudomonadota bacterium]